jgi:hypothetical protein
MLFFRSEEMIDAWCRAKNTPRRPTVTMDQLWKLATTWYSSRLTKESRRPAPAEMRTIFEGIGLRGDFWDPAADTFG